MKRISTVLSRILKPAVLAACTVIAPSALAQTTDAPAETSPARDEVVVTAGALKKAARAFVDSIAAAPAGDNTMARWDRMICPGVTGFVPDYAQRILDQITRRAFEVGLNVGEPGCTANILVLVTVDPDGVAQDLFDTHREELGRYSQSGQRTMGRDEMQKFLQSEAPVRWWHVSRVKGRDGAEIAMSSGGGSAQKPTMTLHGGSARLSSTTRQDFASAIIIVDARRLGGVTLGAFADYLAMVGLAQIDSEADTAEQLTILNLFAEPQPDDEPLKGMTAWDLAYLKGLYEARRDARNAEAQEGDIARTLASELSGQ